MGIQMGSGGFGGILLADLVLTRHIVYTWYTLGLHLAYTSSAPCQHVATMSDDCSTKTKMQTTLFVNTKQPKAEHTNMTGCRFL